VAAADAARHAGAARPIPRSCHMKVSFLPEPIAGFARRHPYLLAAGVLAVVLVAFLVIRSATKPATAGTEYFTVRKGDFTVTVVEGGTLQAVNEVSIRNEVEGTARIIYIVPEGTIVKKGDLLVELDSMQAQDQYNQQMINFEKARFALIQAEKQLDIQRSQVDSEVRAAELKLLFAEMDLDKYLEGESKVELLTASNNITKTAEQLTIDRETLRWSEQLVDKGYETKNVLDRDRLTVTNQELNLQIQQMQLWMIHNYDFPKQKATFESAVEEAGKDLERVKQQGSNRIDQYTADLLTQSNTLALNKAKLDRDLKNLDATKITAPQGGLVVYPIQEGRFSQESRIEEGATVRNRQELIKLPDVSRMKVTIKVHESSVNMVNAGQPAFVVLDSMPDQRFRARVERVAPLPDAQSRFGNPNLKVYNTEVVVVDPLPDVKPGVSARAEIIVTNVENALSVPVQAVTTLRGKQVVYVAAGGASEPRPVEVGLFNTRFIQLVSGVQEGERVLLSPPFDPPERDLEGSLLADGEKIDTADMPTLPPNSTRTPGSPGDGASREPGRGMGEGAPSGMGPGGMAGPEGGGAGFGGQGGQFDREAMRAQMEEK
ncbi:MAG TPA: efflux RND transporter periplasmic adaptor subunit, partial [Desulfosarcina sp.]|nr:efflux RND transporter periplasmic adaptor subunit [Desulfosarcina sp.]